MVRRGLMYQSVKKNLHDERGGLINSSEKWVNV